MLVFPIEKKIYNQIGNGKTFSIFARLSSADYCYDSASNIVNFWKVVQ